MAAGGHGGLAGQEAQGDGGGGFGGGCELAQEEGGGSILRVAMTENTGYGWRVTYHGNLRSARREVEGQVWYAVCQSLAQQAESVRDRDRRRETAERLERELGLGRRKAP